MANTRNYRTPTRDDGPDVALWNERLAQDVAKDVDGLENALDAVKELAPQALPDKPGWAHVELDAAGNVLAGFRTDGSLYVRSLDYPGLADAVKSQATALDLVTGKDARLPQALPDKPGWAHVELDAAGNVLAGFRTDGTLYVRSLDYPGLVTSTDPRLPQGTTTITGWDHIELDAAGNVLSGLRTDGTYYFRSLDNPALNALPQKVAGWGDSMFGDHGGTGTSTLSALSAALGVEVHLGGIPGQTSTEAALRQGGLDVFITAAGNTIPASGPVDVTVVRPAGTWKTGSAWNFSGSLAGIAGTLSKSTTDTWTFTRGQAGAVTPCKPETRWMAEGASRSTWVTLFRAGKNAYVQASIERDYAAAFSGLAGANRHRFLALPVYNSTTETKGTNGYNTIMAINAALEKTYGEKYYDLRGWLIRNGLAEAGITPTQADTDAIAQDCLPPSLMYDNTHLTVTGRQIEAARLAHIIKTKGWIA